MPNWAHLTELQRQFPEELQRQNVKILFYEEGSCTWLHTLDLVAPLQEYATYQDWFELGHLGVLDPKAKRFAPMELSLILVIVPKRCSWCSKVPVKKHCGRCNTYYCNTTCQSRDWPNHQLICVPVRGKRITAVFVGTQPRSATGPEGA